MRTWQRPRPRMMHAPAPIFTPDSRCWPCGEEASRSMVGHVLSRCCGFPLGCLLRQGRTALASTMVDVAPGAAVNDGGRAGPQESTATQRGSHRGLNITSTGTRQRGPRSGRFRSDRAVLAFVPRGIGAAMRAVRLAPRGATPPGGMPPSLGAAAWTTRRHSAWQRPPAIISTPPPPVPLRRAVTAMVIRARGVAEAIPPRCCHVHTLRSVASRSEVHAEARIPRRRCT
mmetsp:Transcript_85724/g.239638  ORF Transcript_85724/g.239638 Transcript_85724/m.239638 type:complete len:229 (-) Transcript_85724:920-1606(-)